MLNILSKSRYNVDLILVMYYISAGQTSLLQVQWEFTLNCFYVHIYIYIVNACWRNTGKNVIKHGSYKDFELLINCYIYRAQTCPPGASCSKGGWRYPFDKSLSTPLVLLVFIRWIVIYLVNSVIHLLNNRGQILLNQCRLRPFCYRQRP